MERKICALFPGQGSQYVGMGKDLYEEFSIAKRIYDEACEILNFDIKKISFEGSEEELKRTSITQPAVLIHSIASLEIFKSLKDEKFDLVMGHSLGEYTALYASGVFDFPTVLKLVKKRGELMEKAGKERAGTMAAVIGLSEEKIKEVCKKVSGICVPANFNSPSQIVIAGEVSAVKEAYEILTKEKVKVVMLPVSGAFHSPLMEPAYLEFKEYLTQFNFNKPKIPIVMNANGEVCENIEIIKKNLEIQMISPVLWKKSVETAINYGCQIFYEIGPGKILSGLVKKTEERAIIYNFSKKEDFLSN
ncbi:MAG: ACP S-malonyltransferase [candidate division WOR-3 bacterium]|nr:ACP S-malonyltransferase [candidate division WOR-3 bacterium]MDW8114354.1 ACP S-malonyltransferase [candidate division WOR-3 bacterium]